MKIEEIEIKLSDYTEDFVGELQCDYTEEEIESLSKDEILKYFIEFLSYQMFPGL